MGKARNQKPKDVAKSSETDKDSAAAASTQSTQSAETGQKLTKQQKRDLKRKEQSMLNSNKGATMSGTVRVKEIKENTSVYRRTSVFPPEFDSYAGEKDRFVRETDEQFADIVRTSYSGFVVSKPDAFSANFHGTFRSALEQLEADGFYQFDLTQPTGLGTKVAKTFVTRCVVGEPGITYKYLGLCMFGHPWTEGEVGATPAMVQIGKRNRELIRHTSKLLKESGRPETGSCQYNLTLINHCFPEGEVVSLKEEPFFKREKCTVSWHADSSLDHYSTIGVYHCTKPSATQQSAPVEPVAAAKGGKPNLKAKSAAPAEVAAPPPQERLWEVSLKVHFNAEGPNAGKPAQPYGDVANNGSSVTPAIAVALPDQYSYYLLDDFNHHHHHSVLAGSSDRFASTHRVSRVEGHTFEYIRSKCLAAIQQKCDLSVRSLRSEQLALSEVEFEWIRQFYVQGAQHHALHSWWHAPMTVLMDLWVKLESRSQIVVQALRDAALGVEEEQKAAKESSIVADETTTSGTCNSNSSSSSSSSSSSRKKLMKRSKYAECVGGVEAYDEMIAFLTERQAKRDGWHERAQDPLYKKQPLDCQPTAVPFPDTPLTEQYVAEIVANTLKRGLRPNNPKRFGLQNLNDVVAAIKEWRAVFAAK